MVGLLLGMEGRRNVQIDEGITMGVGEGEKCLFSFGQNMSAHMTLS